MAPAFLLHMALQLISNKSSTHVQTHAYKTVAGTILHALHILILLILRTIVAILVLQIKENLRHREAE